MAAAGGSCSGGGGGGVDSGTDLSILITTLRSPCPSQPLDASFASASSPFLGSRSMVSFRDFRENKSPQSFFGQYDFVNNGDEEWDEYFFHQPEKKRRLSVDQVQFLEKSFNLENKLEPERKVQLAKDLGLQPRQIAIWFQNRRARWKSKQLEKDFDALQDSYNTLKAEYDRLLYVKDNLKAEVDHLTEKLLVKENGMLSTKSSELNALSKHPTQNPIADSVSEGGVAKSDAFDSDSPYYADRVHVSLPETCNDSRNVFEREQSDLSQDEKDDFGKNLLPQHAFPKLEGIDFSDSLANPCNFGFPVEDHALWCWSY